LLNNLVIPTRGRAVTKVKDYMTAYVQDFIRHAPFMIMATSGEADIAMPPEGRQPGFVRVLDERHLLVPDVAGNKLFQSYQNLIRIRTSAYCFSSLV
jgi:predicted pyridoxine 5'-phosphate oxidase superfamily flavin-nucleotide-binding protein